MCVRLYDTRNPIKLLQLPKEKRERFSEEQLSAAKEQRTEHRLTEGQEMKFYPPLSLKKILVLDKEKITALQNFASEEKRDSEQACRNSQGGVRAANIFLPSNKEVYDHVKKKVDDKEWELVEAQKLGVFARFMPILLCHSCADDSDSLSIIVVGKFEKAEKN